MGLKLWLPMNGNLNNQGVFNTSITSSGAIANANGKIGSCMKITSQTDSGYIPNFNTTGLTMGGWFKFNKSEIASVVSGLSYSSTANSATGNVLGNTSYGGIGLVWNSNNYYTSNEFNTLQIFATIRTSTVFVSTSSITIEFDKWTHIMLNWNINTRKLGLYKNGVLVNEKDIGQFSDGVSRNLYLNYRAIYGGNGPSASIPMYCNDIMVYDNALTANEIKKIAQGLVLRYPLSDGVGQDNLALNTHDLNVASSKNNLNMYIRSGTRQLRQDGFYESKCTGSWHGLSFWANQLNLTLGTKITYSFYIYGNGSSRAFSFYPMMYNSSGTRDTTSKLPISIDGGSYTSANSKTFGNTTATTPEYHYVTFEWSQDMVNIISNGGSIELSIQTHGTWNTGDWACLFAPKVELGGKPTPWTPASTDTLYNALGLSSNIIYDTSGYGYNGTKSGTVSYSSDTPRYNIGCFFNNNGYIDTSYKPQNQEEITIAFWFKFNVSQRNCMISCYSGDNAGSFIEIESFDSKKIRIHFSDENKVLKSWVLNNTSLILGKWYFCAVTYTKITHQIMVYINDDNSNNLNNYSDIWQDFNNIHSSAYNIRIGSMTGTSGIKYNGYISDFRIYATALSAEDILEIYKTPSYLASNAS